MGDDDEHDHDDDDFLDGCTIGELDEDQITRDEDIDWTVLFASVVAEHKGEHGFFDKIEFKHDARELAREWKELFSGT